MNNLYYEEKRCFSNDFKSVFFLFTLTTLSIKTLIFMMIIGEDSASKLNVSILQSKEINIILMIAFLLLILSFSYLFTHGKIFILVINIIVTFIYLSDLLYYRSNSAFINFYMFQLTANLNNLGESILSLFKPIDILMIIDIPVYIILITFIREKWNKNLKLFAMFFIIPTITIGATYIFQDKLNIRNREEKYFSISWAPNESMYRLSPIGYHGVDLIKFIKEYKPLTLTEGEKREINEYISKNREDFTDSRYSGILKDKNLLLIQVESLENFVINKVVEGQEITPNINKLLKNSLYFNNIIEQTHKGTTSDAELLVNTSLMPIREGSTFFRFPNNTYPGSLPNVLKGQGYRTLAAHADKGSYWNWVTALSNIGYEKTLDITNFNKEEEIGMGLSDLSFFKQLAEEIENLGEPFLTMAITLTSHGPFILPEEYKELRLNEELDRSLLGKYYQVIRYVDTSIGEFLKILQDKGIMKNTVVVIYGDHEGVNKYYPDDVIRLGEAYHGVLENNLRVPFIIYSQDIEGKVMDVNGGQIDIYPTIAYLMGLEENKINKYLLGRNLLNTQKDYTITALGEYIGEMVTEEEMKERLKLINISDRIINSDFFK